MKQLQNIITPLLFLLCAITACLWFSQRKETRRITDELNTRIERLTLERDEAKGTSRQIRTAEVESFLHDYKSVFTMLKNREIDIYKQMIKSDSNILVRVEQIRTQKGNDWYKKWRRNNADARKHMENRIINMLKGEIRYCEHHIRIAEDGHEDENEYSGMLKTYPRPLFYESEKDAAEN